MNTINIIKSLFVLSQQLLVKGFIRLQEEKKERNIIYQTGDIQA